MSNNIHRKSDLIGGRYEVIDFLGEGGMQEVYLAKDGLLGRNVAVKAPKNNSAIKRFKRSAVVSARVNHANVAKTLDYIEGDDRSYLVEELVVGADLSKVLGELNGRLDPQIVAKILHHLAKGVAASHHADVVHRDLKPSNVMSVGGSLIRDLKITDFGIAKMAEEEIAEAVEGGEESITASQTAIGALPYMAPEMIESMKDAGKPVDIWSLGAMTFELMLGKRPFGAGLKAIPAILAAIVPPMPSDFINGAQFKHIATEIYEIVSKCLSKDPTERPTADQLVTMCETLCYPITSREFGTVTAVRNTYWGFITSDGGDNVFYHVDSIYGSRRVSNGDRVWYARHKGGNADRAFPIVKAKRT